MHNRMKTVGTVTELQPHCVGKTTAASMAGISTKTLERLVKRGECLGQILIGRRVVFRVDQLKAWLDRQSASQHRIKGGRNHE